MPYALSPRVSLPSYKSQSRKSIMAPGTRQRATKTQSAKSKKPEGAGISKATKKTKTTTSNKSSHPGGEAVFRKLSTKQPIFPSLATPGTGNLADTEENAFPKIRPPASNRASKLREDMVGRQLEKKGAKLKAAGQQIDPRSNDLSHLRRPSMPPRNLSNISNISVAGSAPQVLIPKSRGPIPSTSPISPSISSTSPTPQTFQSKLILETQRLVKRQHILRDAVVEMRRMFSQLNGKIEYFEDLLGRTESDLDAGAAALEWATEAGKTKRK